MSAQRGVALVAALLVVAMVTTMGVALASRQQMDLQRARSHLQQARQWQYLMAGAMQAKEQLPVWVEENIDPRQTRQLMLDDNPLPQTHRRLQLSTPQASFNINSLVGDRPELAEQRFRRLLKLLDLDPNLADAIIDWLDEDTEARTHGAEDAAYHRLHPPYRAANAPMRDLRELRLIRGIDEDTYWRLRDAVCALPMDAGLDINRADLIQLQALLPDLHRFDVEELLAARAKEPFETLEQFAAHPAFDGTELPLAGLALHSRHFHLLASMQGEGIQQRLFAHLILEDESSVRMVVLHRLGDSYE